jgi:5'-methylthioadenosine phosphorylase
MDVDCLTRREELDATDSPDQPAWSRVGKDRPIINMTAYPEGYLARELELCYANISMVTDHDVGVEGAEPVSHEQVVTVFNENNERLRELLFAVIPNIRPQPEEHLCATALRGARI